MFIAKDSCREVCETSPAPSYPDLVFKGSGCFGDVVPGPGRTPSLPESGIKTDATRNCNFNKLRIVPELFLKLHFRGVEEFGNWETRRGFHGL